MTIPLAVVLDVCEMGPEYIGYQVRVPLKSDGTTELVTIASVVPLRTRLNYVRLTFAEYPGYHYDATDRVKLCAAVEPVRPAESDCEATGETPAYVDALRRMSAHCAKYGIGGGYRRAIHDLAHELGVDLDG